MHVGPRRREADIVYISNPGTYAPIPETMMASCRACIQYEQCWACFRCKRQPTRYVTDNGRIVLDAFDHGLRNFPELPVVLSSELEGSDIEYYYRQNAEIADYDLVGMLKHFLGLVVLHTNMHKQPVCLMAT